MKTKAYAIIILVGILLFIITLPLRAWHPFLHDLTGIYVDTFTYSLVCFFASIFLHNKFRGKLSGWIITVVFLIVTLFPDIFVRCYDGHFIKNLASLPDPSLRIVAVLLGWLYSRIRNKPQKITLGIVMSITVLWVSVYGMDIWAGQVASYVNNYTDNHERMKTNDLVFIDADGQSTNISNYHGSFLILCILENEKQLSENLSLIKTVDQCIGNRENTKFTLLFYDDDHSRKVIPQVTKLLEQNKLSIPYMYVAETKLKELRLTYRPEMVIINREGRIVYQSEGRILKDGTGIDLEKLPQLLDILGINDK